MKLQRLTFLVYLWKEREDCRMLVWGEGDGDCLRWDKGPFRAALGCGQSFTWDFVALWTWVRFQVQCCRSPGTTEWEGKEHDCSWKVSRWPNQQEWEHRQGGAPREREIKIKSVRCRWRSRRGRDICKWHLDSRTVWGYRGFVWGRTFWGFVHLFLTWKLTLINDPFHYEEG